MLSPICLFTYNRFSETKRTIEALTNNYLATKSNLFIFSDGPKNSKDIAKVIKVRNYLSSVSGFKSVEIIECENNKGLAKSIVQGVSRIIIKHERSIVLEDDLITTPNFLNFMNQALDFYRDEPQIQSISGYSLSLKSHNKEVYFQQRPGSWGWATWKNRWNPEIFDKEKLIEKIRSKPSILNEFKHRCGADISRMLIDSLNGKNDSWYVRWAFNHFVTKRYSIYPKCSFVDNIGFNAKGTHCKNINCYISEPVGIDHLNFDFPAFEHPKDPLTKEFLKYFTRKYKIGFRLKLIESKKGRKQLANEVLSRTGINQIFKSFQ